MLRRRSLTRVSALVLLLSAPTVFAADAPPVARVGTQGVSADALTRRLSKLPGFQRSALADSPEKLKRQVLQAQLIPELLYAQEAERQKLSERPGLRDRRRELLREALDRELRKESARTTPVTADDIRAYFEANRARFETPARIHVWRLLLDDEALAKKIIADSKGVDGLQKWSTFARENSLDKATHLRNGDVGFVHPDGNTDTPTVRVDPALFATAEQLADGAIAPEPLKLGTHFAVLWRRGSMKAITRTLAQEEGSIRQVLERERLEKARETLLAGLRTKYVSANNEALLETFPFNAEGLPARPTAAREAHPAAAGSSVPRATERGER